MCNVFLVILKCKRYHGNVVFYFDIFQNICDLKKNFKNNLSTRYIRISESISNFPLEHYMDLEIKHFYKKKIKLTFLDTLFTIVLNNN